MPMDVRVAGPIGPRAVLTLALVVFSTAVVIGAQGKADGEDWCSSTPPPGFEIAIGLGEGPEKTALERASRDARLKMEERACHGLGDIRCDAVRRHIDDDWESFYDARKRLACVTAALETSYLNMMETEIQQLELDFRGLASSILGESRGSVLDLRPPTLGENSGCVLGEIGSTLLLSLKNELAGASDNQVRLLPDGSRDPDAAVVRMSVAIRRPVAVLSASVEKQVWDPETETWQTDEKGVGGFDFPLDLFGLDPNVVPACRADDDLGIVHGRRQGFGGLTISLSVPSRGGVTCEGKIVTPTVRVSQPAYVKVFSILKDGQAWLVWPPAGGDGRIEEEQALEPTYMYPLGELGDEKLAAVGVPVSGSLGKMDGWSGFCRSPGAADTQLFPPHAAVSTVSFRVAAAGTGHCPEVEPGPITKELLLQTLKGASTCGESRDQQQRGAE